MGEAGHTAGIFADISLDGPEIGTLVAVIDRARNLPNRKTMGKQDPYCAMRLGKGAKKTETDRRGGQTPKWDQELRFTVHESPDYYKLKCSVFNEDKKNDLIGEGWIDLSSVIVPGGGQSDTWHQLNFKGKYAGEIRLEMTYYDIRPKADTATERRGGKSRNSSGFSSTTKSGNIPAQRQLGPREVKRRPLPPGPATSSPITRPNPQSHTPSSPRDTPPVPQRYHNHPDRHDSWTLVQTQHYASDPLEPERVYPDHGQQADQWDILGHPDQYSPGSAKPPFPSLSSRSHGDLTGDGDKDPFLGGYGDMAGSSPTHLNRGPLLNEPTPLRRHSDQALPGTHHLRSFPPASPYQILPQASSGLPGFHSEPESASYESVLPNHHTSTSPTKSDSYRDSPLRQSMSHHDTDDLDDRAPDSPEEEHPPPPPVHRDNLVQFTRDSRTYQDVRPLQLPRKQPSSSPGAFPPDFRSPLQTIERNYDPYAQSTPPSSVLAGYNQPRIPPKHLSSFSDKRIRVHTYPRPGSNGENAPPDLYRPYEDGPQRFNQSLPRDDLQTPQRSVIPMHPMPNQTWLSEQSAPYPLPRGYDDRPTCRSQPPILKPQAVSPGSRGPPMPKPTHSSAGPPMDERRLSGVPFGPDSYDVLNPLSNESKSPELAPQRFETPEQLMEAARQLEVERLRDQGPIIGNDGREIDPSDHLPSDTWAPEPERKSKKPEIAIRFRTKAGPQQTPLGLGSSAETPRPQSISLPLNGSAPATQNLISQGFQVKPGRNRLQKQPPGRPLPAQPVPHSHSSPAVPTAPPPDFCNVHSPYQRGPARPALSEYSLLSNGSFGSSPQDGSQASRPPPIPAKVPLRTGYETQNRHSYGGSFDALSAEMRSIDIGAGYGNRGGGYVNGAHYGR